MSKNKQTEIERRFLAKYLPDDLDKYEPVEIEDYKIITGEMHPHLRLRKEGDKYYLTKKYQKEDGSGMFEETIDLNEDEFFIMKKLPTTRQFKKRYNYKFEERTAQIDIWEEDLKGLVIVEFEFESEEASRNFKMPDFCLKDISNLEWLSTGILSGKKFVDLKTMLSAFNFTGIYKK
jgi:adenylate cyclase